MKAIHISISIGALIALAACTSPSLESTDPNMNEKVAADFATQLTTYYPPTKTTVNFESKTKLDKKIEEKLREVGYAITKDPTSNMLLVAPNQISSHYFTYSYQIQPGSYLNRAYRSVGTQTVPAGAWSVVGMPTPHYQPIMKAKSTVTSQLEPERLINRTTTGKVTASALNVRLEPTMSSKKIGLLAHGKKIVFNPINTTWARYKDGYIAYRYVSEVGDE